MNAAGAFRKIVIDQQTASGYCLGPISCLGCTHLAVYVLGLGTTSGGVVTVEESSWDDDAQVDRATTWAPLGTAMNASASSAGVMAVQHFTVGAYDFVRVRISTAISGGGTISAWLVAAL